MLSKVDTKLYSITLVNLVIVAEAPYNNVATGKNSFQCCLNTLGSTLHRSKPYVISSLRLQTTEGFSY